MPQKGTEGFWKSVAHHVPREATEIRILNPYFIQEAAFQFIGLPFNNGLMGKGVRAAFSSCGKCVEVKPQVFSSRPNAGRGSVCCQFASLVEIFEGRENVL